VLVSTDPPLVLFLGFLAYAVSGPLLTLFHLRRRRLARRGGGDAAPPRDGSG
jgi:CDP-diacylglycerol--serine O-phosphatidyltransferase